MQHYQEQHSCSFCHRVIVIDILSNGTPHQSIMGVACLECAKAHPGQSRLMEPDEVEDIKR